MENHNHSVPEYWVTLLETLRQRLLDPEFIARHRVRPQDFTRSRILPFGLAVIFILQHTVKSIQRHLREFFSQLKNELAIVSVSSSAWTQARAKLKHTAFIELNQACMLPARYESKDAPPILRWRGLRLLAVDSSTLRLPMWEDTAKEFGIVETTNQTGTIVALELYNYRWGIETYYFLLKSRLSLENFSGKTAESIRQDFFSAVLLAHLESLLSAPAQEKLQSASENTEYKEQVNRANSYHALKFLLLDLLYRNVPALAVIEQLQKWFEDNPVRTIRDRKVPRTTPSFNRSDHFQRRVKKTVF